MLRICYNSRWETATPAFPPIGQTEDRLTPRNRKQMGESQILLVVMGFTIVMIGSIWWARKSK